MPSATSDPSDLIDPEAPVDGGARVDTAAYAAVGEGEAEPDTDLAHPGAADILDVEAPPPAGVAPARAEPPPPPADPGASDDLYRGEGIAPPPHAGPDLGGGAGALARPAQGEAAVDAALDALLALCTDRPWDAVSLRDVAERAGVSFAALYARAPGKSALLARLGERYDRAALHAVDGDRQPQAHDRLFEAFMARLEAMAPHRDVLIAISRAQPLSVVAGLGRTARALAEGAGVDTSGARGALRVAALAPAWARTLQVWRDDEGALNRTMAEIDRLLRRASRRLSRVGAGF